MFVLGVTGPIGSGKSSFVHFFVEEQQSVIDADQLSHTLCDEDELLKQEIVDLLGAEAYDENGKFHRSWVSEQVFKDKSKLDALSFKIHQAVIRSTKNILEQAKQEGKKLVILDFPLPIQEGFLEEADHVLVLSTPEDLRLERLKIRGLSTEQAKLRMAMQMSQEEYNRLAHTVVQNQGDLEALRQQWLNFVKTELWPKGILLNVRF